LAWRSASSAMAARVWKSNLCAASWLLKYVHYSWNYVDGPYDVQPSHDSHDAIANIETSKTSFPSKC
jgi:hypothetical protein